MRLIPVEGRVRLTLAAIGDIGLIGAARSRAAREGYDAALELPGSHLRAADLAFANLEFPVGREGWVRPGRSREFWHDPEVIPALMRAGVRVVSLATNHAMDCGPRGLEETLHRCASAGLLAVGAGPDLTAARRPARIEVNGQRVGVLAYSQSERDAATAGRPGVAPLQPELMREDIAALRTGCDVLVVSVHWGSMYVNYPPPRVRELAAQLAAAGVDLVLGHHPHVIQGATRLGTTLCLFSLGDGVFNCRAGDFHARIAAKRRLLSGVFTALLAERPGLDFTPHELDAVGFPIAIDPGALPAIAERMRTLSEGVAEGVDRFGHESAPELLRYEVESVGHYLRQGRIDKLAKLAATLRPRHFPVLWKAATRLGRGA